MINRDHWLKFHDVSGEEEVIISYSGPFDLNDNQLVDKQAYRAGRRLKIRQGKHPCSKTPSMHLYDWSCSFDRLV